MNNYYGNPTYKVSGIETSQSEMPPLAPSMRSGNAPIPEPWRERTPAQKHEFKPVENAASDTQIPEEEILELVTEADINDAYRDNKTCVYCEKKALITPSAKDRAVAAGIKIIRMKGGD